MYRLIKELILQNGLEGNFKILEKGITGLAHGSEFIFKGMQDIKSLENIDIAIVEEAQQVSKENAERLIPTIRKSGSQIWWLWNPENEDDWVHQYFIENQPPNAAIQKVNYTDNIYCSRTLIDEANYLKDKDYEEYRHVWLGELKPQSKGWRFINPDWLDHAASGAVKPLASPRLMSRCAIGSDPAMQGVDDWVTVTGKGNRVLEMCVVAHSDSETIAANLNSRVLAAGRYNCDLGVDGIGAGIGVCDVLEKRYHLSDILDRLTRKDMDFVPPPPRGTQCPPLSSFMNWKSQAWYLLRHDLETGNIDLSELKERQPEEFRLLKKELIAHDMETTQAGKMKVKAKEEVKKELGWSPGRADALVAWNWVRRRVDDLPRQKSGKTSDVPYMFV